MFLILLTMNPHIKTIIGIIILGIIIGGFYLLDNYCPIVIEYIAKYFGLLFIGVIFYAFMYHIINGGDDYGNTRPKR